MFNQIYIQNTNLTNFTEKESPVYIISRFHNKLLTPIGSWFACMKRSLKLCFNCFFYAKILLDFLVILLPCAAKECKKALAGSLFDDPLEARWLNRLNLLLRNFKQHPVLTPRFAYRVPACVTYACGETE